MSCREIEAKFADIANSVLKRHHVRDGINLIGKPLMKDQVSLDQMKIFVAIGETRTYTEAAAVLGVPISKVSRAIKDIEAASHLRLVGRIDKSVHLTETGQAYLASCRRVLAAVHASSDVLLSHRSNVEGTLRVGIPSVFARSVLVPLLPQFRRQYPRLRLELLLYTSSWDRLPTAEHDLLIKVKTPNESSRETRVHLKPFPPIRQGLFASPAYLASSEPIESLESMREHKSIGYSAHAELNVWEGSQRGRQVRVDPSFDIIVGDAEMQLGMALVGLGVALLPLWLAHASVVSEKLIRVVPEFEGDPVRFNVLHNGRSRIAAKERAFLEFLDSVIAKPSDPRVQGQAPESFFLLRATD